MIDLHKSNVVAMTHGWGSAYILVNSEIPKRIFKEVVRTNEFSSFGDTLECIKKNLCVQEELLDLLIDIAHKESIEKDHDTMIALSQGIESILMSVGIMSIDNTNLSMSDYIESLEV